MKKDRSNQPSSSHRGLGLPRTHILKRRSNFKLLFERRAIVYSGDFITIRFRTFTNEGQDLKMGFVVSKRLCKAVQRNRIKRRMREAYRHHQYILADVLSKYSVSFHGVLMARKADFSYAEAEQDIPRLLNKAGAHLQNSTGV